jgi:competence protein ComEC
MFEHRQKNAASRRAWLWVVLFWAALFLLAFLWDYYGGYREPARLAVGEGEGPRVFVHVLDVGQGSSILIIGPDRTAMIDFGEREAGAGILRYLGDFDVDEIDLMAQTHPHTDHYGGMETVFRALKAETVLLPDLPESLLPANRSYADLSAALAEGGLAPTMAYSGLTYELGGGAVLTVLGPPSPFEDLNNCSLVIRLDFDEASFLFTGDIEKKAETSYIQQKADIDVDVLSVAHHGSNTSSSLTFLNRCTPLVSVISVGEGNLYGHPHADVIRRLTPFGPIFRTDLNGAVVFITDGKTISVKTQRADSGVVLDAAG